MSSNNPKKPDFEQEVVSLALDFTPFVGSAKSFLELATGKDLVTGEHISRWIASGGIILGFIPFGKALVKMRKEAKVARSVAYGIDKNREEVLSVLEKVFNHHTPPLSPSNPQSRYQYELLRKQLRLEEGMISNAERKAMGRYLGGHALSTHGLSSKFTRHPKIGEFRSEVGHDYGRFGKERLLKYNPQGQSVVRYEPVLLNRGDEFYALNTFRRPFQDVPWKTDGYLEVVNRQQLYNFVLRFLRNPKTVPIREGGKIVGYRGKEIIRGNLRDVVLYNRASHEGTLFVK